jgi:hypothetical protein
MNYQTKKRNNIHNEITLGKEVHRRQNSYIKQLILRVELFLIDKFVQRRNISQCMDWSSTHTIVYHSFHNNWSRGLLSQNVRKVFHHSIPFMPNDNFVLRAVDAQILFCHCVIERFL